jgi:hypothetical protein
LVGIVRSLAKATELVGWLDEHDFAVRGYSPYKKFPSLCSWKTFPQPFILDAAYSIFYLSQLKLEKLDYLAEL